MTDPSTLLSTRSFEMADEGFLQSVSEEAQRARRKFPPPNLNMTALTEEVGELAKALLEAKYKGCPWHLVYDEAVQVAVMAMRVAVEGDPTIAEPKEAM